MLLDSTAGPLVMSTLRVWDHVDELVPDIVWLNPDTMMASARTDTTERRVRVSRFRFQVHCPETAEQLSWLLPQKLHRYIEILTD